MTAAADQPPAIETVIVDAARLPPAASEPAFSVVRLNDAEIAPFDRLDVALKQVPALSLFRRTSSLGANPTTQGVSLRAIAPSGAGPQPRTGAEKRMARVRHARHRSSSATYADYFPV